MENSDKPEWRTIPHCVVMKEVRDEWDKAVRLIRLQLGVGGNPNPSWNIIMSTAATILRQSEQLDPTDKYRADAEEGYIRCWYPLDGGVQFTIPDTGLTLSVCGAFCHMESHHSIPRSLGGHGSERIWLCSKHHGWVSDGIMGQDWRWLRQALGYGEGR